jgi:hypothetical protein
MLTQAQVAQLLGLPQTTMSLYLDACRRELSPGARRKEVSVFTEADIATLRRFQAHLAQGTMLEVSCAWCNREIGIRPGGGAAGRSHGMCPRCAASFLREYDNACVAF